MGSDLGHSFMIYLSAMVYHCFDPN